MRALIITALLAVASLFLCTAVLVHVAGMHEIQAGPITGHTTVTHIFDWLALLLLNSLPVLIPTGLLVAGIFKVADRWPQHGVQAFVYVVVVVVMAAAVGFMTYNFYVRDFIMHWGTTWTDAEVFHYTVRQHTIWWLTLVAVAATLLKYRYQALCRSPSAT